jgi:RNA polymerase sigma-70 factor (ECF subfamily)
LQSTFDSTWHENAMAGSDDAVVALARACTEPLYRFCYHRIGRNQHLCEEIVQETMLRAIRDLAHYNPARSGNNIFPWLTGLARNEIRRVLAREKATVSLETMWDKMDRDLLALYERLDAEPFSDDVLRREETREMVGATMSQLPAHYREALEAKYVLGKSVRDIATSLEVSEKTVESQLTRARKAFRATFLALTHNLGMEPS